MVMKIINRGMKYGIFDRGRGVLTYITGFPWCIALAFGLVENYCRA